MSYQSFSEQLWNGMADAISDIRQKVIEEPMWGRSLGDNERLEWPEPGEFQPSFGSITREIDMGPRHDQIGENANYREAAIERDQDIDLDR